MKYIVPGLLIFCIASFPAFAETFTARVDNSQWEVRDDKLFCKLEHTIPGYGTAEFFQHSGKQARFVLKSTIKQPKMPTDLYAYSPLWYKNKQPIKLLSFNTKPGYNPVQFNKSTVGEMLHHLKQGMQIRFISNKQDETERVVIHPAGFKKAYKSYMQCLSQLVPYAFNDLKKSTVHFDSGSLAISEEDQNLLDAIADTIINDEDITRVHITGHSDTKGNYRDNRIYALKRMWKVKDYLVYHGVDPDIITQQGHADAKPVASNKTAKGRAQNRRVEIKLYR